MTARITRYFLLTTLCWMAATLALPGAATREPEANVTASFSPAQLGPGEVGEYRVTVSGTTTSPKGNLPAVAGLEILGSGSSSSIRFVNGEMTAELTLQFQVRASKPGKYTIPAWPMTANGKDVSVPAATLDVTDHPTMPTTTSLINLTAQTPRTDIYVGEKLPLDITATWRPDLQPQIAGEFTQDNDGFERVGLTGKPDEFAVPTANGRFAGNTWHTTLTPLKAGPQSLHFTMPLLVMTTSKSSDPFTQSLLGASPLFGAHQEQISVVSTPMDFSVLALPDEGRPANFTGGIGEFVVSSANLDSTDLQVGVPATYKITITGQGNFDRFQAPVLDLGSLWRTYAPQDSFKSMDATGYHGSKTFEYVIMPLSENVTELPPPQVNFFDPEKKAYVQLPGNPIAVKVKSAPPGQAMPLPAVANNTASEGRPNLIALHMDAGAWQSPQPRSVFASPYFWAMQVLPAAMLAGFVVTRRRQLRLENDPVYARRRRARQQAQSALERARAAAAKGHAAEFYTEAQRALQAAASHDRADAAEALTWLEFDAHLAQRGTASDVRQQAREIFDAGDALRFGGFLPDQADLAEAARRLDDLVKKLLS